MRIKSINSLNATDIIVGRYFVMKLRLIVLAGTLFCSFSSTAYGVAMTNPEGVEVGTYGQEMMTPYTMAEGLPSDDVLAVAAAPDGGVYAGTSQGLAHWENGAWISVAELAGKNVTALWAYDDGVYAATESGVYLVAPSGVVKITGALPATVHGIATNGAALYLATGNGLWHIEEGTADPIEELAQLLPERATVCDVAVHDGRIAAATDAGLFVFAERWEAIFPQEGDRRWAPVDVRAVGFDNAGRLWFAAPMGVGHEVSGVEGGWQLYTGHEGLPYNDFTSLAIGEGTVWFGTSFGAIKRSGDAWMYREGRQWLLDNAVRDVAIDKAGSTWLATAGGVSHIHDKPMTFAQKAVFYEDEIDARHRRTPQGYVAGVELIEPADKSEWIQHDTDNDGQYTGMYGGAECLGYAATGDPRLKKNATAAFEGLAFLSEVTQGGDHPAPPGFIARTILPVDGPDPNEHNSPENDRKKQEGDALWKVIVPRWPVSKDGEWYWKSDASSDELDGHYSLYGLYYDHVAETEEEKARVREVVRRVTDHLLYHDFRLVDHDGKPTRWANFSPRDLNDDPAWWAERGLNSFSVLTYLSVAHHITGDERYHEAYEYLIREHKYALNGMVMPKLQAGPGSFVQFDDKMAFMNYYHLIQYEDDPELLNMYRNSAYYYWQIVKYELNPFFNFVYAVCCDGKTLTNQWGTMDLSPTGPWLEQSIDTLKRYPMDLVNWKHTNSKRIDLAPLGSHVREPGANVGKGYRNNGYVLPIDERQSITWSEDSWDLDTGGDGRWLDEGSPYLLAYYLGLYHGYIK